MSAPTTPEHVCNLALDILKQEPIANISDPTSGVESICARWYDPTRKAVLREHTWNFAIQRKVLTRVATPAWGFSDSYNLPNDYIRILSVETLDGTPIQNYEIESGKLLMDGNGASVRLRYIFDVTLVPKFDSLFMMVLAIELARVMCYAITGSNDALPRIENLLRDYKVEGTTTDGQERPPTVISNSKWKKARARGTSGASTRYQF
jgi:hypothetical protein